MTKVICTNIQKYFTIQPNFGQNNDNSVHTFANISTSFFSFFVSKDENRYIHNQPTIQFSQPFVHMI